MSLWQLFKQAGIVGWPLGLCSVLALGIILERFYTLARLRALEERGYRVLKLALEEGNRGMLQNAEIAAAPVTRVLNSLAATSGNDDLTFQESTDLALSQQRLRLRRYL